MAAGANGRPVARASAALHRESPSSGLLLGGVGSWQVLAGLGAAAFFDLFRPQRHQLMLAVAGSLLAAFVLTAGLVARSLYVEYPRYAAEDWLYGSREAVAYLEARSSSYDGVLVSDRLLTPHILVLFFTQTDPATYQLAPIHVRQPNVRSRGDFGAYQFGRIADLLDRPGRHLVWLPANEARSVFRDRQPLLTVTLPDGTPSQMVYETERR